MKLIVYKDIIMNDNTKTVFVNGDKADLTFIEYQTLKTLMLNTGKILSRSEILEHVWGNNAVTPRAVDTTISRLRSKLRECGETIKSKAGFGYGIYEE